MGKTKTKKQSDQTTLAEVTLEMAKPRVAMSARERDTDENRDSSRAPSQAEYGDVANAKREYVSKDSRDQNNPNSLVASRRSIRFFHALRRVSRTIVLEESQFACRSKRQPRVV